LFDCATRIVPSKDAPANSPWLRLLVPIDLKDKAFQEQLASSVSSANVDREMDKDCYQENGQATEQTTLSRWQIAFRSFRSAFKLENFPFVVLGVLATLSLLSRLWLLKH
jgi:hypothetical protein